VACAKAWAFAKPLNRNHMRHQPENNDWMGPSAPYSDSDRRKTTDQEKDKTKSQTPTDPTADPGQAPTVSGPGRGASRKRKLEDLNDREDLSERQLSDRNWF
jgi:hypothetical protein